MCNVCKHEVNNVRLVPFCYCAHFPCMLIYGLCAKGLTTAMCCLACVVRLARTQTFGTVSLPVVAGSETQGLARSSGLAV